MKFKNLTRNPVTIFGKNGPVVIQPEIPSVSCKVTEEIIDFDSEFEIVKVFISEPEGLPPEELGVGLIVSKIAADSINAYLNRDDIYIPRDQVRQNGQVVGCRRLEKV